MIGIRRWGGGPCPPPSLQGSYSTAIQHVPSIRRESVCLHQYNMCLHQEGECVSTPIQHMCPPSGGRVCVYTNTTCASIRRESVCLHQYNMCPPSGRRVYVRMSTPIQHVPSIRKESVCLCRGQSGCRGRVNKLTVSTCTVVPEETFIYSEHIFSLVTYYTCPQSPLATVFKLCNMFILVSLFKSCFSLSCPPINLLLRCCCSVT